MVGQLVNMVKHIVAVEEFAEHLEAIEEDIE